jgi:hypothetical protein
MELYFNYEIDERKIKTNFNHALITDILYKAVVFTTGELLQLNTLQAIYTENIAKLSVAGYKKELDRLVIDLSWKSS